MPTLPIPSCRPQKLNRHPDQPELAHPFDVLHNKAELVFASPQGGVAPLDPASVEAAKDDPISVAFKKEHTATWEKTHKLSDLVSRVSEFDAVFYPGGHGPMFDLVNDANSIRIASDLWKAGKPVTAVCHGPAALLNVNGPDGASILKGKKVTGFSDSEEDQAGFTPLMPFSLEKQLNEKSGGGYGKAAENWGEKVFDEGQLIVGQNPASAKGVGEALAKALSEFRFPPSTLHRGRLC